MYQNVFHKHNIDNVMIKQENVVSWSFNGLLPLQNKLIKQCWILYLVRTPLTQISLKQIYYTLMYPLLTYCHVLWGGVMYNRLKRLHIAQNKLIITMTKLKKSDHTNASLSGLLKLNNIDEYYSAMFVYKSFHKIDSLMLTPRSNNRYHLRNSRLRRFPLAPSWQYQTSIDFRGV